MKQLFEGICKNRKESKTALSEEGIDKNFISIMEVLYGIVLALSLALIVEKYKLNLSYSCGVILSVFVLVRFFFAPTKNIVCLGKKGMPLKWLIMIFDVPILMLHSVFFYFMCKELSAGNVDFYKYFSYLLALNFFWLGTIWLRYCKGKKACPIYIKIWTLNNILFAGLILIILSIFPDVTWMILFFTAMLNCFIDLGSTYPYYLRDSC